MVRIISALILAVTAACASAQEPGVLVDNPPDRHVVVPGDTLWSISARFLKEPWRWPDVWRLNKEDIRNPHRIYPGDIVLLDRSSGKPQLKVAKSLKVQPKVYSESLQKEIPSIPANVIEPFISRPLIVEANTLDSAPVIVASQEDRVYLGSGDSAFVAGIPDAAVINWQVYRPGTPLKDPDTGEVIGFESFFLGDAKLHRPGNPAMVKIVTAKQEIGRGDRLVPAPPATLISYAPHKPEQTVSGRIMSIYGGVNEAGKFSVITINRGTNSGLEPGHVLALYRKSVSYGYNAQNQRETTPLPDERYALIFVFRTFERVSYALVMESSKPVIVGDSVHNP